MYSRNSSSSSPSAEDIVKKVITKGKKVGVLGGLAILALVTGLNSFSTVGPGERGVMVTMGKTGTDVLGEGPHLKLPFVSTIKTMSIRVHKSQDSSEAATKDMQRVGATVALNWTINPESVADMYRNVGTEETIETNIIAPAVSEVLKAATAKLTAEEVLTKRLELKSSIDEMLIKRLTSYGLVVKDISLVDLNFTQEFDKAVEDKQIAEQQAKQAEYNAQKATQDAKAQVNAAKGQAESNLAIAKADAKAQLIKAKAQAEGQRLLRQNLTKDILKLEYLKKWDGQLPSVLTGSTSAVMLNLSDYSKSGSSSSSASSSNVSSSSSSNSSSYTTTNTTSSDDEDQGE